MTIQLKRQESLYQQIAMYYETAIREGRLKPGTKLPSTNAMAKQFGVNPLTVQSALKILMNQGLVHRTPGRGTIVRGEYHGKTIGIILGKRVLEDESYSFFQYYVSELIDYISSRGWKTRVFMTSRDDVDDVALYELRKAVESGELGGTITACENRAARDYVEHRAKIPQAAVAPIDYEAFLWRGMEELFKRGFQKIHIISNANVNDKQFLKDTARICESLGHSASSLHYTIVPPSITDGYHAMHKLWHSKDRPLALLIGNDIVFRGVWQAILEERINIPEELSLITYMNKEKMPITGIPVTNLSFSVKEIVREVFNELENRISGKKYKQKRVQPVFFEGTTCRTFNEER